VRIKTGVPNMDALIDGGIPEGDMFLVYGECGTGKTTFALQYVGTGVADHGDIGVFVTFVDHLESIWDKGKKLGIALAKWRKLRSLKVLGGFPGRIRGFDSKDGTSGGDLVDEILRIVEGIEADRLALDGVSWFEKFFETEREFVENLARLRRELRKFGCTSVLTSAPGLGIEELMDDVVIFHYDGRVEKERFIEVVKMRASSHADSLRSFEITDDGIEVSLSRVPSRGSRRLGDVGRGETGGSRL